jgi:hypothetical protein
LSESPFTPSETQQPQAPPPSLPFRLPADYYSAPVDVRPLFPKWVPLGCGIAAATFIAVMFVGGALVSHGGVGRVMDFFLGMLQGEMTGYYSADVKPESRKALESELSSLRANIRAERVPVGNLDPVMSTLRAATADKKITNAEVDELRKKIHEANKPQPLKR